MTEVQAPTTRDPDGRRRMVVLVLNPDDIARLLNLEPDMTIVSVSPDWMTDSIRLKVHSDEFDPVSPGCEPPVLHGDWQWDPETETLRFVPPLHA